MSELRPKRKTAIEMPTATGKRARFTEANEKYQERAKEVVVLFDDDDAASESKEYLQADSEEEHDQDVESDSESEEEEQDEGDTLMGFGRHANLTFGQVYNTNRGYYKWAKRLDKPSPQLQRFLDWVDDSGLEGPNGKTVLTVGKHAGKTYSQVYTCYPGYVHWIQSLNDPCKEFHFFRTWVAKQKHSPVDDYVANYARQYRNVWE